MLQIQVKHFNTAREGERENVFSLKSKNPITSLKHVSKEEERNVSKRDEARF